MNGRGSRPLIRYGTRGCSHVRPGWRTNVPRSTKWSKRVTFSPLPIGATGIRISDAWSMISAVVCLVVHAWIVVSASSMRRVRPANDAKSVSSSRSGRSMSTRKSWNCCAVIVQKPT